MELYVRNQYHTILSRIEEPRRFIQVIVGPRQVGKTTLVGQVLKDSTIPCTSVNADAIDRQDGDWIRRVWESARVAMQIQHENQHLLVVDEIQKIDDWSERVKAEWDRDSREGRNLKVILLGSSRLLIKKGLSESLAGRFELVRLSHWSLVEMRDAFGYTLDDYIYFGGYPGSAALKDDKKRWKRYIRDSLVAPAIEKDVIMTSNIYKPALMKRTFELGCSYSSELLSLTKMVGQLQDAGNVTTIAGYLEILKQSELLCGLQKYARDEARKYSSIPKFQVYNNALLTAYRGTTFFKDRQDTEAWGRWVESAVGAFLVSQTEELGCQVYYWRERADEVDFIISNGDVTLAIEVKSGRRAMNSGLPKFCDAFHPTRSFVVGTGGVPLEDFLSANLEELF